MSTSPTILKLLAALVWYCGVVVLVIKSSKLFFASKVSGANPALVAAAVSTAIIVGWVKGWTMFSRICLRNLQRIDSLKQPKIHQFYRPRFFFFLALMITLGATLGRMAQGNTYFLLGLATLELSVGTALFVSSFTFFKQKSRHGSR